MKKYFFILSAIFCLLFFPCRVSWGQSSFDSENPLPAWQESINKIKANSVRLMEENDRLNVEYQSLKEEWSKLAQDIERQKADNQNKEALAAKRNAFWKGQEGKAAAVREDLDNIHNELAVLYQKSESLKNKLIELNEAEKLWRLKIAGLEAQKSALVLDAKSAESLPPKNQPLAQEILNLREKVTETRKEKDAMIANLKDLQARQAVMQDEMEAVKKQNKEAAAAIAKRDKQYQIQLRQTSEFDRELVNKAKAQERVYAEKLAEKAKLLNEIKGIENQIAGLKTAIDKAAAAQNERRGVVDAVMLLDEENQTLRRQATDLAAEINSLKKEAALLDARLDLKTDGR